MEHQIIEMRADIASITRASKSRSQGVDEARAGRRHRGGPGSMFSAGSASTIAPAHA